MAKETEKKSLWQRIRDIAGELRKVSWPSFRTVVKQTGVVLGVTLFFLIACIGMDSLLGWLYGLLVSGLIG